MSRNPKKSLVLLLSLLIAALPLRFAVGGMAEMMAGGGTEMTAAMPGCVGLDRMAMEAGVDNPPCPAHSPDGNDAGNCCGDHCGSSAQLFPSLELSLYIPPFSLQFQEFSPSFPTLFLSPGHRPPLTFS